MLNPNNQYTYLRKELLYRFINFLFDGKKSQINRIPYEIIPMSDTARRCCIYKDREMIKYRLLALMGYEFSQDFDESYTLQEYFDWTDKSEAVRLPPLTVIKAACSACKKSQYRVTELCKGCLARPCQTTCPRNAVSMVKGKALIELDDCINCGKCKKACPYGAIVYAPVPCEEVCPVGAIEQNSGNSIDIVKDKCISCGKCTRACPFDAIVERSHILPVVDYLKDNEDLTLLIAPSILSQLPGTKNQIISSLKDLGFSRIFELAESAENVASLESQELMDRMSSGDQFMTTSCCPAYVETVKKHIPDLMHNISHTDSPMFLGGVRMKKENPFTKTVFVGPCMAKKVEASHNDTIDFVLNFEELGALLISREIEVINYPSESVEKEFSLGNGFARSEGVSKAVENYSDNKIRVLNIDGINKKSINLLKSFMRKNPKADLIEVMACEGGCEKGPCTLC